MPGVVAIYSGEDVKPLKTPPPQVKYPGRGGVHLKVPERPILARERLRYVGQEVALAVATSPAAAQDAAEASGIENQHAPAAVDGAQALGADAPLLPQS